MYKRVKRAFDFISALLLFMVISPLFLALMICVSISIGRPVFFSQVRSGLHMKPFKITKFRTMTNARDNHGNLLPDEERLTKVGRVLRSTSLDELPELLSIIKGDMSVIGPRPLPPAYDAYYTEREKLRFQVRGGLIPPEVLYRNVRPTWDEQLEYEADYAERVSAKLDLSIIAAVFRGLICRYSHDYGEYVRNDLCSERVGNKNNGSSYTSA